MWMNVLLLLLAPVAVATTVSNDESASPVRKVVRLLEEMQTDLQKEQKTDQDNYDKLSCWCKTSKTEKEGSIEAAQKAIEAAEADIEERTARKSSLEKAVKDGDAEAQKILDSLDSSDKQRTKEGKKNQETIKENTYAIQNLKGAVIVLKKHQADAFPQMGKAKAFLQTARPSSQDRLDAFMDSHDFKAPSAASMAQVDKAIRENREHKNGGYSDEEMHTLGAAKKLVANFMQGSTQEDGVAGYASKSGEIFGILTTMLEQMERDLKELEETEAKAFADFKEMRTSLNEQLGETEEGVKRKTAQGVENLKNLASSKTSLEDNTNTVEADTEFLKNVVKTCEEADAQQELRSKSRTAEIQAVGEAIDILLGDEANTPAPEGTSPEKVETFLQMSIVRKRSSVRKLAAEHLQKLGEKHHNSALIALSATVQLDGFVKVKKAINDMIADLTQQQVDEVKHKDFCQTELQANDMTNYDTTNTKKDLESKLDVLDETGESLKAEKKTAQADLAQLKVDQQQASMDRVEENKAFQVTIDEQRATVAVVEKALVRLEAFYGRSSASSMALTQGKAKAGQQPPVQIGDPNEKSQKSGGVLIMLENIIEDANGVEKEAQSAEQEAQTNYEQFATESNASMEAKMAMIVNLGEQLAANEQNVIQANEDLAATDAELEDLAKYKGDLHTACDFVLKNFDLRQGARTAEMDGLKQAIGILSGA